MAKKEEMKQENQNLSELVYIQSNLKAPKNQRNNFGGYNYRSCEDIMEAVKPLLKEVNCSLTLSDEIVQVSDRIYVKATATMKTPSGEIYQNTAFAREALAKKGMDESQVTGAASSYARKYALNGLFCIDDTKDADALNVNKEYTQPVQQQTTKQAAVQEQFVTVFDGTVASVITSAKTMEQLTQVWNYYPGLQQNKEFRDAWAAQRGLIEKK